MTALGTKEPLNSEFRMTASEKSQPYIVSKSQSSNIHTPLPGNIRKADIRFRDTNGDFRHIAAVHYINLVLAFLQY